MGVGYGSGLVGKKMLSLREMVVWLGIGPFEAFIHSVGLSVFLLLLTMKVENVLQSSWHVIFIPLYVSLSMDMYYNAVQSTRIIGFIVKNKSNIKFFIFHFFLLIIRIGLLIYTELILASILDGTVSDITALIPALVWAFLYLAFRLIPIVTLVRNDD